MARPMLFPTASPAAPMSPAIWRNRMERTKATHGELHDAVQGAAGRYLAAMTGTPGAAVPQKGATTPAAVAWHRYTKAQAGFMNRRMRRFLERDNDARMAHLAEMFG